MTTPAESTVFIDDDRFRVVLWRFPERGASTGHHVHQYDYVVVPLTDGRLRIETPDGEVTTAELTRNVPYTRNKGVEHTVISDGDDEIVFIEIERI
jgi:hypothetical protein